MGMLYIGRLPDYNNMYITHTLHNVILQLNKLIQCIQIFGFTILATGIVMNNYGDIVGTTEESAVVGAGFLIVVGSILTIVGFTGVCGAFCNTDLLIKIVSVW